MRLYKKKELLNESIGTRLFIDYFYKETLRTNHYRGLAKIIANNTSDYDRTNKYSDELVNNICVVRFLDTVKCGKVKTINIACDRFENLMSRESENWKIKVFKIVTKPTTKYELING